MTFLAMLLAIPSAFQNSISATDTRNAVLAIHHSTSGCSLTSAETGFDTSPIELDDRHSIFVLPCEDFAYNFIRALYLVTDDEIRPLSLPKADLLSSSTLPNQVYSPAWDPNTKVLSSFYKGGNGNCGAEGKWRWTGSGFLLVEVRRRDSCDQSDEEWPIIAP